MLDILMSWYWVHHLTDKRLSGHSVVAILLSWHGVHLVLDQWIKKTLFVSYVTELVLDTLTNWPVIKSEGSQEIIKSFFFVSFGDKPVLKAHNMCYVF